MSRPSLALYREAKGRPCPRVDLTAEQEAVIECAQELRVFEGCPVAADEAWRDHTAHLGPLERTVFRHSIAVYLGEVSRLRNERLKAESESKSDGK